jgi:hypothetical protein
MTSQYPLRTICFGTLFCYAVAFVAKSLISAFG